MISTNNTILSSLNKDELLSLFREINNMSLKYRDFLNLPDYVTFGNEIEVNKNASYPLVDNMLKNRQTAVDKINEMFNLKNGEYKWQ